MIQNSRFDWSDRGIKGGKEKYVTRGLEQQGEQTVTIGGKL